MNRTTIGILTAAMCTASAACAQGGMGGMDSGGMMGGSGMGQGMGAGQQAPGMGAMQRYRYQAIDQDGDGIISRQELQQHQQLMQRMQENWEQADRNKDGVVDQPEFSAFERLIQEQEGR